MKEPHRKGVANRSNPESCAAELACPLDRYVRSYWGRAKQAYSSEPNNPPGKPAGFKEGGKRRL